LILPSAATLLFRALALLIAAPFHEFAHGYAAAQLGDPTPRRAGRLTLNPLAHLDPLGTILLLVFGFGWAKPVPIDPTYFPNWRRGLLTVAAAGPVANVVLAILFGFPFKIGLASPDGPGGGLLLTIVLINAVLAIFNLIPIPPLDGSKILVGILPGQLGLAYARLSAFGPLLLLLLLIAPARVLGALIDRPLAWLVWLATGLRFSL